MRWPLLLFLTTGCRQLLGFESPSTADAPNNSDGPDHDVVQDGPETCIGAPGGLLPNTCFVANGALVLAAETLNTDTDARCDSGRADACFVFARTMIVANLEATGSRPLVLASETTIVVTGSLDASSRSDSPPKLGPGTNGTACLSQPGDALTVTVPQVGGGGTGGAYGSAGGTSGSGGTSNQVAAGFGGPPPVVVALRGGCDGASGGLSPNSGGRSGGAVYLMAGDQIDVESAITASGAGGNAGLAGSNARGGGGGGGSGGLIGLDAPVIALDDATLLALGGGGGSGASALSGDRGGDPQTSPPTAALGGVATTPNNAGGAGGSINGSAGLAGGSIAAGNTGGGGGGGGGAGHIVVFGVLSMAGTNVFAPPLNLD